MNNLRLSIFILILSLMTGCEFTKDSFTFKDKTKAFVESLMKKEYDKCVLQLTLKNNTNIDSLKIGLDKFRESIQQNFGTSAFDYSLMQAQKKRSTVESENTPPNTTLALVQFSTENQFGVFEVLFDDETKRIINIKILDIKSPKPDMIKFWMFGFLPLIVLCFNVIVIRKIKKSSLTKKWLKYLAVLFFNVPAISYAAVAGLSFNLLNFQILLGISFSFMGYMGCVWTFGIPLGGIYWLWKLNQFKENETVDMEISM